MQTLLQIKISIFSDNGESSRLAHRFAGAWRAVHPDGRVIARGEYPHNPRGW